jgi:transposase InsO family protein
VTDAAAHNQLLVLNGIDVDTGAHAEARAASMGSAADCFDNALAESVFATLECELFDQQPGGRFATRREAKLAVLDYLKAFYNPRRRHSALGHLAPATFEARHTLTTAA